MAKIVIKKRVNLDFLGEEYKESYLVFKSISLAEYQKVLDKLQLVEGKGKESVQVILKILQDQFIEGVFQEQKVESEDLMDFDIETMSQCFELFTGKKPDPKV